MIISTSNKLEALIEYLIKLKKVAIAFSGGVDSTFLLKIAKEVLGAESVVAITVMSNLFPRREFDEATEFCKKEGIAQLIFHANQLDNNEFANNPPNRCYICKLAMFNGIINLANRNGFNYVCEGSNADDLNDYRPGLKAIDELGVKSPLRFVDLSKAEIREISKNYGLETWNKPSFACLASRFVYGEKITENKIEMVDKAEQLLLNFGLNQFRVRIHNDIARIEIEPEKFDVIINNREMIDSKFKTYGFKYVALDLIGYRTGSMNEAL